MWLQVSHDLFSFDFHSVVCFKENMWSVTQELKTTSSSHLGLSPWALVFDLSVCTSFFFFLHLVFAQWCVATGAKLGEELCRSCMFHSIFFVPKPQTSHALLLVISHAQSLVTSPQVTIIIHLIPWVSILKLSCEGACRCPGAESKVPHGQQFSRQAKAYTSPGMSFQNNCYTQG
jgi:hypothetical protein